MLLDRAIVEEVSSRWRSYGGDRIAPRDLSAKAARTQAAPVPNEFWTKRGLQPSLDGSTFKTISTSRTIDGLSLPPDRRAERILGSSDLIEIVFLQVALAVARTVARIRVNGPAGILLGYGTGFMVSPRLLLTNWHVLKTAELARTSTAEFGYETRMGEGAARVGATFPLQPERFYLSSSDLDFALVAVAPTTSDNVKLSQFGFNRLSDDDESLIAKGQFSNIIQHPSGQPKQLAFRQNEVIEKPGEFLHYRTDTAPGSSGAPVFNDQWQVVALHRAGVWATNDAGQPLAVDGSIWREEMGEDRIRWLANEGVRIPRLLAKLRRPGTVVAGADYVEELLQTKAPSVLERTDQAPEFSGIARLLEKPDESGGPASSGGSTDGVEISDGIATWTIPLRVSVGIGNRGGGALLAASGAAAPSPVAPAVTAPVIPAPAPDLDTVLRRAREAFTKGRDDVLRVRAGWAYDDSGITDRRAIVVVVRKKRTPAELATAGVTELPTTFEGYPVEIMGPSVADMLRLSVGPVRTEALLATAVRPEEITYQPPAGLSLDPVTDTMRVVAHASPDAGWATLGPFIAAARKRLVGAMYEFTAEHIREALTDAARPRGFKKLTLVLDSRRGSAGNDPSIRDSEAMVRDMRDELGDKLEVAWVKLGSVNGWVNHDYHIKVLVRDDAAFWLSSGNWKTSGQPDQDPSGDNNLLRRLLRAENREWHAVIEHPELAQVFQKAILGDFENNRLTRPEEMALPDLWSAALPPLAEELFENVRFFAPFDQTRQFVVQPVLTPDNYLDVVVPALRAATTSILIQNQSLTPTHEQIDPRYEEFWKTVLAKQKRGLDVRLIFRLQDRDVTGGREMHDGLKDYGFDTARIKVQKGCHTKGIIIDGKRVLLGSHNLTNTGATTNRDASLLFDDEELAGYFTGLFQHDWDNVATKLTRRHWRGSELRERGSREEGFVPFDWKGWLETQ